MKILPDSIRLFLINRLFEIGGVSSILLSIFVLISIASYSAFDPNIYNLSNNEITNLGGQIGANTSEIMLQLFGYNSYLVCIVLASWSYKLIFQKELNFYALNILLLPFTTDKPSSPIL